MRGILRAAVRGWTGLTNRTTVNTGYRGAAVTVSDKEDIPLADALPPEQMPGPRIVPFLGTMHKYLPGGEYDLKRLTKSHIKMHNQYGPIVRERFGANMNIVHLFDVKDVEKLLRAEGKFPVRPMKDLFIKMAEDMKRPMMLVAVDGEEWHRQRTAVQKDMMQPRTVGMYIPAQDQVAGDLVEKLRTKRNSEGEVVDILLYLQEYSVEAVGVVCFDRRLGVFDITDENKDNHDGYRVVKSVQVMFEHVLPLMSKWYFVEKGFFKKQYQIFLEGMEDLSRVTEKLMSKAEETCDSEKETVLNILLKNKKVSRAEATNIMVALLGAGIESTAFTLSHVIYQLAKNPKVQEKLYEELSRELPDGQPVTYEILSHKLKYLRAVIRETNRISPAATKSVKRVLDHDEVFGGYRVPAGWLLFVENAVMSLLPKYFEDPEEFRPERWLTENRDFHKQSAFIVLPFGHGARTCLGRRFAEQELYLATIKLIQNFKIEYHHRDLELLNLTFQELDGPLSVKLIDRK